ncbi:NAD(P)/FAD-dependent oxidoreductase [Phyllobacterium sp. YR531]|uniref:FAD-dependent oxidoreductase n=1 Tax=Phyllobacterium sp. YR531 TaxID=1144343 RepID=UPI00026F870C|nr:NAD(P)/FAD-dependent oxidoreductase [Phyllobacterium sp. YR531]EJN04034.1 2-polyprenyl-6-methoxyphenol hydroxylase-like oxidoreductase [Phyllobacterium sp. YR531]
MNKLQIAIVGGGPAGLAAALYLKRANHHVTVFERFASPSAVGSGLILQPTGLTILDDLGLFQNIQLLGNRIDRLYGADAHSGRTVLDVRYSALKGGRYGIAVHRAALFDVLYNAVRKENIDIETNVDILSMEVGAGSNSLIADNGRRIGAFDLVVDASGSKSKIRSFANKSCEPKPLVYGAYWATLNWHSEGFHQHSLLQRYRKAGVMIGVLPIGKAGADGPNSAAFFWSTKPGEESSLRNAGIEQWKDHVLSLWPECSAYVDQIDDFGDMTLARYGHHTLPMPIGRNLAVIGDAAHSTSPQLGQGANMALLDAKALAHALVTTTDVTSALSRYAQSRRLHIRGFQTLSRAFTPFYQSDSRVLPFIRDRVVPVVSRIPPAPHLLASMVSGTLVDPFEPIGLKEKIWI